MVRTCQTNGLQPMVHKNKGMESYSICGQRESGVYFQEITHQSGYGDKMSSYGFKKVKHKEPWVQDDVS